MLFRDLFDQDGCSIEVAAAALEAGRKAAAERKAARAAQTAATGRPSLIDAFNEAYTVDEILLQAGYDQRGHTFRHPASTPSRRSWT